ncbi:hypothetical protein [Micromonospora aurantiaca]|uniref:hypothetical protein n=1 Tax=Micromonospora aurantiaca (nom. illeg.) TaxID=47850 RepID=UPI00197B65FC|nr:hypothetical protein [Micromonospora aurantiaca]
MALARRWKSALVGAVLAFGAGTLMASVAFELAQQGVHIRTGIWMAVGVASDAATFFLADAAEEKVDDRAGRGSGELALTLGSLLDGIPEQAVLGIGLAAGEG